jgi:malic enzyme
MMFLEEEKKPIIFTMKNPNKESNHRLVKNPKREARKHLKIERKQKG